MQIALSMIVFLVCTAIYLSSSSCEATSVKHYADNIPNARGLKTGFGFAHFIKILNKALDIKPFKVFHGKTYKVCLLDCAADQKCVSFNFAKTEDSYGLHLCEMMETDILNNTELLKDKDNYLHFTIKTECLVNPCKNQGLCYADYRTGDYTCKCQRCFHGRHCEREYRHALGMEDGRISDSQITASSHFRAGLSPHNGRLNKVGCWCSWSSGQPAAGEYLQVDLGTNNTICKVATQGRESSAQWVTTYFLHYSNDGRTWTTYSLNDDEKGKVFEGNSDSSTVVCHNLQPPFYARCVRFVVKTFRGWPSMRVELYSCK